MKKIKNPFTLVEIILAMGIIVVCITTIMGMLSYGISVSNDAVMQNYMSNVLEQVGGIVETHPDIEDIANTEPYNKDNSGNVKSKEEACTDPLDTSGSDPFLSHVYYNRASNTLDTIKIEFTTDIQGTQAIDFTAYGRLYITNAPTVVTTSDGSNVSLNNDTLHIQLTWPASKPYVDRISEGNVLEYTKVMRP